MKKGTSLAILMLIALLSVLIISHSVSAQKQYHLVLLAVQEENESFAGSTADLYLELQPGKSRVFLETLPVTKIDTQISTRFAKEIACSYFNIDCSKHDFIYTIKADTNIVGGPSAGAATAVLTSAALHGIDISEKVTITGTINSGGTIGPVGGIKQKIEAAAKNSIETVLIPIGTREYKEGNGSVDLVAYGGKLGLTVMEVADVNEALFYFTGKKLRAEIPAVSIDPAYRDIMQDVSEMLCARADALHEQIKDKELGDEQQKKFDDILVRIKQAENATKTGKYYAAASYCFGASADLRALWYKEEELELHEILEKVQQLKLDVMKLRKETELQKLETIAGLQTYGIVRERLDASQKMVGEVLEEPNPMRRIEKLAFAEERYYSAVAWSRFFEMSGKVKVFEKGVLKRTCTEKILEARERVQYAALYFPPQYVAPIDEKISEAEKSSTKDDYALCLMQASEAKGDANALLSVLAVEEKNLGEIVKIKLSAAERVLAEATARGIFPILGYSYYEYANSLAEKSPSAALVYTEYALEFGNFNIYFEKETVGELAKSMEKEESRKFFVKPEILLVVIGLALGLAIGLVWKRRK